MPPDELAPSPNLIRPAVRLRLAAPLLLLAGIAAFFLVESGAGTAQELFPEPAVVTIINLTSRLQTVDIDQTLSEAPPLDVTRIAAQPEEPATFLHDAGPEPQDLVATCSGCRAIPFSLAAGQRVLVVIVNASDPAPVRSDLHVVNESGARRSGVVRTGLAPGDGRTFLPFDLRDGESARVGLRLPRGPINLNLTCPNCDPQQIRVRNGVDLEVVIQ